MEKNFSFSEFLLLEFSASRELQILHFLMFLVSYLAIVSGNLLIICAIVFDHHLHTPMYFFLMNLAILDLGSVSAIVPKSMANSFMNTRHISVSGCAAQVFFFAVFVTSDFCLLTVMAYDRYVAICNPLHYEMVMNKQACIQMIAAVWVTCLFYGALHTAGTFLVSFCSNVINQFFCEIPHLLNLSCSDSLPLEIIFLQISAIIASGCAVFIIVTYVLIFSTVLRIPSAQGRKKAFFTCLPHLIVFSIFIFTGWYSHLRPPSNMPSALDLTLTVIYTFIPPLINPVVYSMRNKEMNTALTKLLLSVCFSLKINCILCV